MLLVALSALLYGAVDSALVSPRQRMLARNSLLKSASLLRFSRLRLPSGDTLPGGGERAETPEEKNLRSGAESAKAMYTEAKKAHDVLVAELMHNLK